jgi:UDP-3-O-[3-hydroxymyristoyl] glucosamine N-acyltransferase
MSVNEYNPKRLEFAQSRLKLKPQYPPIGSGCAIDDTVCIGEGTVIRNNVTISGNVVIGKNCFVKSNTVIGEKGFSFGFTELLEPVEIVHTGGVLIGDNVEIGALCTVCSGTLEPTIIEDFVKIDDHIHIAHNCHIEECSIITAGVALGGGVHVESYSWLGLSATIASKVRIARYSIIGQGANVLKDTKYREVVIGNPAKLLRHRGVVNG